MTRSAPVAPTDPVAGPAAPTPRRDAPAQAPAQAPEIVSKLTIVARAHRRRENVSLLTTAAPRQAGRTRRDNVSLLTFSGVQEGGAWGGDGSRRRDAEVEVEVEG